MATVGEVALRFKANGAKDAVRADRRVRDSIKTTAKTAQKETGKINRWQERHQSAIQAIGIATAATMGAILSASPTMRAELSGIRMAFSLFADTVVRDVLPAAGSLTDMAFNLQDAYSDLPDPVREAISTVILLAGAIGGIAAAAATSSWVFSALSGAISVISGVAATVAGILSGPLVLGILAVLGAAAALYVAWTNNWGGIRDTTGRVISTIRDTITGAFERIKTVVTNVIEFVYRNLISPTLASMEELWAIHGESVMSAVDTAFGTIKSVISRILSVVQTVMTVFINVATGLWSNIFGPVLITAVKNAFSIIKTVVTTAVDLLLTSIRVTMSLLQGDWEDAWNAIAGFLDRTGERIVETITSVKDRVVDTLGAIGSAVTDAFANAFNAVIPSSISIPSITIPNPMPGESGWTVGGGSIDLPQLRQGGFIERGGLARLHAGERVVPAAEVGRGAGGNGGVRIGEINVEVDGAGSPKRTAEKTVEEISGAIGSRLGSRGVGG
ncbi:hypothetical protein [Halovivax cerinus]|uniref:Uncharacterized protein n=1 Tax=Halovivax cerinus TaxID=1487865 RepID=A0ABD5NL30_9EURY|nr:hypothetical protein [Halovivax cerinus]